MGHVLLIEFSFFFQFLVKVNPVNMNGTKRTDLFFIIEHAGLYFIQTDVNPFCLVFNACYLLIYCYH